MRFIKVAKPAAAHTALAGTVLDTNRQNVPKAISDAEYASIPTSGVFADEITDLGGFEDGAFYGMVQGAAGIYESISRFDAGTDNAIAATGVEHATALRLPQGILVTTITFVTGGTAANGPTAGYVVLRDSTGAKLAQSADFGSTARAANTAYAPTLSTAWRTTYTGLYYIGISFTVSTTVPTLRGATLGNAALGAALVTGMPIPAQSHGSAVGATAPATIATPTTLATPIYYVVS